MACPEKPDKPFVLNSILVKAATLPVRFYRYAFSPLLGSNCRFYPSCSSYSIKAIESHGVLKGGYLSVKRILKCHPWHPGGIDPVPHKQKSNHQHSGSIT